MKVAVLVLFVLILAACSPATDPRSEDGLPTEVFARPQSTSAQTGTASPPATPQGVPATAVASDPARPPAEPVIVLRRGGGLIGVSDEWLIYADGLVESKDGPPGSVPAGDVADLLNSIVALGFFNLNDDYTANTQCNDCFLYEISVTAGGQTKTVTTIDSVPEGPRALTRVIDQINQLLDSAQDS